MKQKKAFTLVELLVVIAVIALLLAILMPALRLARNQARRVFCGNNIHQIVLALTVYATENNSLFPRHDVGMGGYWLWGMDWDTADELMKVGGLTPKTFYCPANIQQTRFWEQYWYDWRPNREHIIGFFSLWDNPPPDDRGWQPYGSGDKFFPKSVDCKRASEIELMTDVTFSDCVDPPEGRFVVGGGMTGFGTYDNSNHLVNENRPEGTNAGFVDGHVNWRNFPEMEVRTREGWWPCQWW